jgi:hypothetical protein
MGESERFRFAREAEILSSVGHPMLLALLGGVLLESELGDSLSIVINYMPRCSHDKLIAAEWEDVLPSGWDAMSQFALFDGAAVAMMALDSKKNMDCDLKCGNPFSEEVFDPRFAHFVLYEWPEAMLQGDSRFTVPKILEGMGYDWSQAVCVSGILAHVTTMELDFSEVNEFKFAHQGVSREPPPLPPGLDGE